MHLRQYDRTWLRADVIAGVTSWALVVPQAVAYAQIAGLSAQSGLAAAFAGPLGYALLGTSRQLMVSPTSSTAAISAALVAPLAMGDAGRFVALSAALAVLTGVVLWVLGWLRLGFVSQFLTLSVQVGFMFGLGMVITVGQVPKVLGIAPVGEDFFLALWGVLTQLGAINPWSAALGLGALAILLVMKRVMPAAPAALIVVVLSIVLTAALGLTERGVAVVGAIPQGLPMPGLSLGGITLADLLALLPAALVIAVMGYAESASVAQELATQHGYDIKPDRELKALGAANVLSGLFRGFIVGGGASQSAANDRAGAKTQMSSLVVAALTVLTAFALTPLFFYLPDAVLGAIVINAVMGFFRTSEIIRFYHLRRDSFYLALFALVAVLLFGVLPGLILAITVSILTVLTSVSRANGTHLGKAPGEEIYGDLAAHPDYQSIDGVLIYRFNGPVLAVNARRLRELLIAEVRQSEPKPHVVILDLGLNYNLDIETNDILHEIRHELSADGIDFWLANVHSPVRAMLARVEELKLGEREGAEAWQIFATLPAAVATLPDRGER